MKTRSQALQMEASGSKATTPNVASSSRPPQRKKIKKEANSEEQVAPKRRRRNLSALPTLPLDVLYEIFSHLDPADLLHLSRTTKSFRSVLMSRQSAFVWRAVLDSVSREDYPACPEDMSEPSWVNLIWGGPWCGLCGSRAQKILWALRRRLCKSCAYERLVRADRYLTSVTLSNGRHICDSLLLDILPSDYARTSSANGRKGEYLFCWDEDVKILNSDVEALQERSSPEEFKSELNKYVSQKKAELQARRTFAAECALLEEKRQDDRQDEIHNLKEERFNQVKARLLDEGYNVADISSSDVRMHNEVWNPKPLTNRVWTRVGPIIREVVEKIRERRITREREDRLAKRKDMVAAEYVSLLRHVAHTSVSFMPSLKTLLQMEPIASAVDLDTEPSEEFIATAEDAIDLSLPLIEELISMRMECLRKATPDTWITALPSTETGPSYTSSAPKLFDLYRSLATHDLAVYVYRCPGINHTEAEYGRPVFPKVHVSELHFGLDALAHQCTAFEDSPELKTEPYEGGHLLVGRILQLLSLDPATTTALDMDSRQDYFTCDHCQNPYDVLTWRAAIIHWSKHHEADEGLFHVLDPEARAELDLANDLPSDHSARMWGCSHCSAHFGRTHRGIKGIDPLIWFTYTEAKAHATAEHNIASPALVNDIFVNRQAPRTANPSTSYGMLDPWQYIPDFYSLLMQGIDYPPWLDYESDFDDGFSSEYFSDDDLDFMF